jgi:ferritin-like metal-binding protein YciE
MLTLAQNTLARSRKNRTENLRLHLLEGLREIYGTKKILVKKLYKLAENANSIKLQETFKNHWKETQNQVRRLEDIFKGMNASPLEGKCVEVDQLLDELEYSLVETEIGKFRDAELISVSQKIHKFETASYEKMAKCAKLLDFRGTHKLLLDSVAEEKSFDSKLSRLGFEMELLKNLVA